MLGERFYILGVFELISVVDGLHFQALRPKKTPRQQKRKKNEEEYMNDARGQRLFSTSVFNVRPFFFWALFLFFNNIFFSILRISFRLLYATVFFHTADGFSSSCSSSLFPFREILLCARTMRCSVCLAVCDKKLIFHTKEARGRYL